MGLRLPLADGMLSAWLPEWALATINWRGYHAVFLFFVLSGFLIASNSLARWKKLSQIRLRDFYLRRAARILPCLIVLLAVLSLLHWLRAPDFLINLPGQSLAHALFSALTLHLNWYEGLTGYLPANWDVLWSLSIEELFYLVFPLACLLLRREWAMAPLLTVFSLALPYWLATTSGNEIWQEKAYLPGMSAIALGVVGALIAQRFFTVRRAVAAICCGAGTVGLVAALCMTRFLWRFLHDGVMLALTLSALCLILGFYWQARSGKPWVLPGTGWLQSCGRLSYEIYLTHMFVVLPAARLFRLWQGDRLQLDWIVYPPAVLLCWALGWIVEKSLSKPVSHAVLKHASLA